MKKKLNVILIIAVAVLWGTVIYKYVSQYFAKGIAVYESHQPVSEKVATWQKDTFEIMPLKRDPFLNVAYAAPHQVHRQSNVRIKTRQKPAPVHVDFPQLNYFGYLKSKDKSGELVLLKVNNKLTKLHVGESLDGLKIVKIYKDSVKVSFNGEIRGIKKN
ncbi:MAG TPA: hypothetical protein VK623_05685 [Flavobacterium sp.]|nr:hypothetical protein [Flavobacterium sp.]